MLRRTKIALVLVVCLWGALGALGNLTDFEGTMGAVGAVATMAAIESNDESWRATSNPMVISAAAGSIVLFKLISSAL